jgi:hypothetical protein
MNSHHPESDFKFAKDIVPVKNGHVWIYNIETNLPGEKIILEWNSEGFDPGDRQLLLLDVSTNRVIDMTEVQHYSFDYAEKKTLKFFYGTADFIEQNLRPEKPFISNYPNPFDEKTTISFGLPGELKSEYRVRLELFNSMGQKVTTLEDKVYMAGYHEFTMNRDQMGTITQKSGIYILKMSISGGSSQAIRIMMK